MLTSWGMQVRPLEELWLDGSESSEADRAAGRSLAARMGEFEGLRPFSTVVHQLIDYLGQPEFKIDRVRTMIESDPALAIRIMRVANSAAFRAHEPCPSIGKAVMRIGASNVVHLSMAMAVMSFFKDLGAVGLRVRDHSAGTGAVARELAFRMGRTTISSQVLLAGLLHDIGKMLLIQTGDLSYAALVNEDYSPNTLHRKEMEGLGFDHAMLGGHILKTWNLPDPLPQIVACHHQLKPTMGKSAALSSAISILRMADTIDWLLAQPQDPDPAALRKLALTPDGTRSGFAEETLIDLWDDLRAARSEAHSLFK
jgi:putative nucleotidyltransferase with HDIG domain